MNYHYKIGYRGIKTSIAVFICLIISHFLRPEGALMSTTCAIICLQQTYTQTLHVGIQRLLGTSLGGICGFIILEILLFINGYKTLTYLFIVPICLLAVIYLCNVIERQDAIVICSIVFLNIVISFDGSMINTVGYVVFRMLDTSVGVIVAMLIDRFFKPNKEIKEN